MNKKQLIIMWCGIAVITLCSLDYLFSGDLYKYGYLEIIGDFGDIVVLIFVIAAITCGLIITFKDKKPKDEQKQ